MHSGIIPIVEKNANVRNVMLEEPRSTFKTLYGTKGEARRRRISFHPSTWIALSRASHSENLFCINATKKSRRRYLESRKAPICPMDAAHQTHIVPFVKPNTTPAAMMRGTAGSSNATAIASTMMNVTMPRVLLWLSSQVNISARGSLPYTMAATVTHTSISPANVRMRVLKRGSRIQLRPVFPFFPGDVPPTWPGESKPWGAGTTACGITPMLQGLPASLPP
mmetsp:Transcript_40674/g.115125  ORF Transcript_40674/g.115125 Transcript_40674/m.115125 type:complete len:223 (-) Transcript_40674:148-816(-)